MDLGMNEAEFTNVLSMFGRARDEFDLIGKHERAKVRNRSGTHKALGSGLNECIGDS